MAETKKSSQRPIRSSINAELKDTITMTTENTVTKPNTKPSNARVEQLINAAKQRGQKLADRNPALAAAVVGAGEKNANVEAARQAAREARTAARALRTEQRAKEAAERAAKRDARKAASAAKAAARAEAKAAKQSAKTKKVVVMTQPVTDALASLSTMSFVDLMALNVALTRMCKERSVAEGAAVSDKPEPGDTVEVIAGDHAGKTGVVTRAQRVRCFVKLNGTGTDAGPAKEAYLYIAQVRVTTPGPRTAPEAAA